jgi:hypothetical protein
MQVFAEILGHLLGWPVVIFVVALMFKRQLGELINRIDLVKAPGIEVASPRGGAEKQLNDSSTKTDPLTQPPAQQLGLPLSTEIEEKRKNVMSYGGDSPMIDQGTLLIEQSLTELQFPMEPDETVKLLSRHLAVTQILYRMENVARRIVGSQIQALKILKTEGLHPESRFEPIFNRARARSPQFYGEYTFDQWINFLDVNGLIAREGNLIGISIFGGEFLDFLRGIGIEKKPH